MDQGHLAIPTDEFRSANDFDFGHWIIIRTEQGGPSVYVVRSDGGIRPIQQSLHISGKLPMYLLRLFLTPRFHLVLPLVPSPAPSPAPSNIHVTTTRSCIPCSMDRHAGSLVERSVSP